MKNVNENEKVLFRVRDGETFRIGEMEFIKFPSKDGKTPVVMRNIAFRSRFGNNNDLRESVVLKRMVEEFLPKVIEVVGEDNVCTIQTDLTTLDGLKPYGIMESRISLPTMEFYRENVAIFDRYPVGIWWWMATPESHQPHDDPDWTLCVSPSGDFGNYGYGRAGGVRPFLLFDSSIFESFEE